ncbi:cysteine desulfurase NifS [Candidatus Woesearchaeota archaeon CG10_big_fil_rev_8_21_14_0_10_45_16]|nr:MAG: cysteine desulfurase NifS [Candidatus Woesearchaeota archaeon CG10_big_fil_rev_8_21_14_0_10_45_16]
MIYLDHAAATPVRKEALKAMLPYFSESYGNPNSYHELGKNAREAVEKARVSIAQKLNARFPEEIIFTGSGTESVNLALQGIAKAYQKKGNHIITCKTEHKAVLETCKALEKQGFKVTYLDVDKKGLPNLAELEKAITKKTTLISIMYVNNETGVIQPIQKIVSLAKKYRVLFHTDACQAVYQLLDVQELGVDLLTMNGSKVYGPKGIGLLYKKKEVLLQPLIHGGSQESGFRSGTENVPGIVGFAAALQSSLDGKKLSQLQQSFERELLKISKTKINGGQHSPHITNVTFSGVDAETLLHYLDSKRIYASAGSACTAGVQEPSHVLRAMGISEKEARSTVRFSFGKDTTKAELKMVVKAVKEIVGSLRKI